MPQNRLKNARIAAGFKTQKDFAEALGVNKSYINRLENGKQKISKEFVDKFVANYPSVSRDYLLHGEGDPIIAASVSVEEPVLAFIRSCLESLTEYNKAILYNIIRKLLEEESESSASRPPQN